MFPLGMPPKQRSSKRAAKPKGKISTVSDGGPKLRPKKGIDFKELNEGKKAAKSSKKLPAKEVKTVRDAEALSLSPHSSDDDLDNDTDVRGDSNVSNSATPDSVADQEMESEIESENVEAEKSQKELRK